MNRLIILSFVAVLVLSGCVGKTDNKNDSTRSNIVDNPTDTKSDVESGVTNIGVDPQTVANIGVDTTDTNNNNVGSEWCEPGSKIAVKLSSGQAEYTVVGITDYTDDNGKTYSGLCKAERAIEGGNSIKYFNKEGTIDIMKSDSSSTNGNARAESSSYVSVTSSK